MFHPVEEKASTRYGRNGKNGRWRCPMDAGLTKAARRQSISSRENLEVDLRKPRCPAIIDVRIMDEDRGLELDHSATDPCPHCVDQKRKQQGLVFWNSQFPLPSGGRSVVFTGKCDYVGASHSGVGIAARKPLSRECGCERPWFLEASDDEITFVVALEDGKVPLDGRLLR